MKKTFMAIIAVAVAVTGLSIGSYAQASVNTDELKCDCGMRCSFCNGTGFNGNFNCIHCKGTGRNGSY